MTPGPLSRVFDTGPLSAFVNADVLGVLKLLSADYRCILVEPVARELQAGTVTYPKLQHVLDADWLHRRDLASLSETALFAEIGQRLIGSNGRNVGETGVIAWRWPTRVRRWFSTTVTREGWPGAISST